MVHHRHRPDGRGSRLRARVHVGACPARRIRGFAACAAVPAESGRAAVGRGGGVPVNREEREELAFCERCGKRAGCTLYMDGRLRGECELLDDRKPLSYRNHEGYADPTAYYALLNIERERKRGKRPLQKRRTRTQVEHYD